MSSSLNDLDQIAWSQRDFCLNPPNGEIAYFDVPSASFAILTTDEFQPQQADINNVGQVAFTYRYDCNPECGEAIAIWEDGDTTLLTDWGINPQMNDPGEIYFLCWHDDNSTWQGWWYDGAGTFYQITDDPVWNTDGDINDYGEAVWQHGNFPNVDI